MEPRADAGWQAPVEHGTPFVVKRTSPTPYGPHILQTYFYLRLGMALLAFAFPVLLWAGGKHLMGVEGQTSMSAYYHTDMRDVFVGFLYAIGLCLLLYKGFSRQEDWALNIGGLLCIGIAMFPTAPDCLANAMESAPVDRTLDVLLTTRFPFHGVFAGLFFAVIGYVCAFCSTRSLVLLQGQPSHGVYLWTYRVQGWLMPILALAVALITKLDPRSGVECQDTTVYRVEFVAIWVFAAFWAVKTWEIHHNHADAKADRRRLQDPPDARMPA